MLNKDRNWQRKCTRFFWPVDPTAQKWKTLKKIEDYLNFEVNQIHKIQTL